MDYEQMKDRLNAGGGFSRHNGIAITALSEGRCQCRVELTDELRNPRGIAHGGLLFSLCDTAAGIAAATCGRPVVTQSSDIHFLRPAVGPLLTAEGRVVKSGMHTAFCTAEVFDESGQLLASAGFEMFFVGGEVKD